MKKKISGNFREIQPTTTQHIDKTHVDPLTGEIPSGVRVEAKTEISESNNNTMDRLFPNGNYINTGCELSGSWGHTEEEE